MRKPKYGSAIHIRLSPEQFDAVYELAETQQTAVSQLTRLAVVEFLERHGYNVRKLSARNSSNRPLGS